MIRVFLVEEKKIFDGKKKSKTDENRISIDGEKACVGVQTGWTQTLNMSYIKKYLCRIMVTGRVVSGVYLIRLLKSWNPISPFLFPCPHCTLLHLSFPSHHFVGLTQLGTGWHRPCAAFDPSWSRVNKMAFAKLLQTAVGWQQGTAACG